MSTECLHIHLTRLADDGVFDPNRKDGRYVCQDCKSIVLVSVEPYRIEVLEGNEQS